MTRRFFSGKTLDQAIMMAARHHGIDPEELAYRQIEKKHGFLRTRKAAMIAVDPEQPRKSEGAGSTDSRPAEPAAPAPEPPARAAAEARAEGPPAAGTEPTAEPYAHDEARSEETHEAGVDLFDEAEPDADEAGADLFDAAEPDADEAGADLFDAAEPDADEAVRDEPDETGAGAFDDPRPGLDEAEVAAGPGPQAGERAPEEAAPPTGEGERPESAPAVAAAGDEELLEAAETSARTLMRFAGIEAEATARWGEERVEVELVGPDASVLVVEDGKGLLAIQHLLPRMMRGLAGRSSFVRVDSQGFHQNRRERLQELAVKEAEAASRNGTARTLPPMAPDERRIVHMAVRDIPTVETESRGTGLHKRVVIRPVTGDGGHDDIEARHGF